MINLSSLNPPQREAVETIEGPLLVLAGAGSGKTRVITFRIAHMIDKKIYPKKILAVTFTNKAAREMKERLIELLGDEDVKKMTVSTFHSLGVRILREDGKKLGIEKNFVIYTDSDIQRVIRSILKEQYKIDKIEPGIIKQIQYIILEAKSNKITPETFPTDGISEEMLLAQKVYGHYESYLRIFGAVDFTDLLVKPVMLFENFEKVKKKYQKRYNYIMVDEYQDTNNIQFEFINHILNENQNICVVGDDDQSIYGFRGANVKNILQFASHFNNTKEIKLQQNYRSTANILKAANSVIAKNSVRNKKTLYSNLGNGQKIKLYLMEEPEDEAIGVADKIQSYLRRKDISAKDIAIMYRSKQQAKPIELKLMEREVPYRVVGSQDFFDRKEIKDFLAYLIVLVYPNDEIHLKRIINYPTRSIGSTTIQKISEYAHGFKKAFFFGLENSESLNLGGKTQKGIDDFLALIKKYDKILNEEVTKKELYNFVDDIGFIEQLRHESKTDKAANAKKRNIILFIDGMIAYIEKADMTLEEYLIKFILEPDLGKTDEEIDEVTLLTIHASKGLEFPYVFLVGFNEGILPHQISLDTKKKSELEEERRLCYVAITRAKKELVLSAIEHKILNGKPYDYELSRFLDEIPQDIIEVVDFTKNQSDVPVEEVREAVMGNLDKLFDF